MRYLLFILLITSLCVNAQQKKDTTYFLVGRLPEFQLLLKAVNEPEKMTREEIVQAAMILNRTRMVPIDSTKKK